MWGPAVPGTMHRYHGPIRTAQAGPQASPVMPSYYLGRPSRVYVARYRRQSTAAVNERF